MTAPPQIFVHEVPGGEVVGLQTRLPRRLQLWLTLQGAAVLNPGPECSV